MGDTNASPCTGRRIGDREVTCDINSAKNAALKDCAIVGRELCVCVMAKVKDDLG